MISTSQGQQVIQTANGQQIIVQVRDFSGTTKLNLFKLMLILPDDGSGGSTSAATGKLRYVTAPGENWEEILLRNILDFKQHANTLTSETHHLLDLFTFVITDIYLRSIGLCKPLSTRLCFSIFIS